MHNVNQQDQLHHSQIQPQLGYPNHQHQQQHGEVVQQNQTRMSRVIRASEYKNLRKVVPSLKRQRDVGKVEVVTEAARYIDHLHKTLIERFVACGIPDSLKGKCEEIELYRIEKERIETSAANSSESERIFTK